MNRPVCLIGSVLSAEEWVKASFTDEHEFLFLKEDLLIEDINNFFDFLNTPSLLPKVGVIYFFNKLSDSKQSVFLKIFEDLNADVKVVIHSSSFLNFTIHTRCNIYFLSDANSQSADLIFILDFYKNLLNNGNVVDRKEIMHGVFFYLETLNLFLNGYISEDEKNVILADLK